MLKFFYIKAMLAPCIESLILLDRLVFLQEQVLPPFQTNITQFSKEERMEYLDLQEDVEAAFLVPLFDPLVSPRCHAIVALKKDHNTSETSSKMS